MARLINESGVLSEAQKINLDDTKNLGAALSEVGFAKMIEAIHKVQDEMGITGTTAKEASGTISGSVASMKAAWSDFLTSLADADADYQWQLDNLLESVKTVAGNIAPIAKQALWSIMNMVEQVLPEIAEKVPEFISEFLPQVTGIAVQLMQTLMNGIIENQGVLFDSLFSVVTYLVETFVSMFPQIIQLGFSLLVSLANGIAQSLPTLIPTIMSVIMSIVGILTDPANLSALLTAALAILVELSYGLMDAIPQLVDACITIIEQLVVFLTTPETIGKLAVAAIEIVVALGVGLIKAIPKLLGYMAEIRKGIVDSFSSTNWGQLGQDLVAGFKNGISKSWSNLKKWFKNLFGDLIGIAKKILGIASPSKVFKKLGGFTAEGFGIGFDDEFDVIRDDMEDALSFGGNSFSFDGGIQKMSGFSGGGYGGTSIGNITINVSGANYSDEQSLAEAIALEIQNMTERRSAAYA
jgi:phage-related protein